MYHIFEDIYLCKQKNYRVIIPLKKIVIIKDDKKMSMYTNLMNEKKEV